MVFNSIIKYALKDQDIEHISKRKRNKKGQKFLLPF